MIQDWVRSALLLLLLSAVLHGQDHDALFKSVSSLPDWKVSGDATAFNESNFEQFDPKLAPALHLYGVQAITVQGWQTRSGQVRATLFQLPDASSAYAFFTNRRKKEGTSSGNFSAGTESFQSGTSYYFWQSRIVARLEGERASVDTLAGALSRNILGRSQRPPISAHLPAANLIAGSEEYILSASSLEKSEALDPSTLGFDSSAEAMLADYRIEGRTARLLVVLYPTQQIAKKYADQLNAATPNLAGSRKRIGALLAIVSNTSDASAIQSLLDQIHYESTVTWSEPQPGLGLGPIIVTVFTFIGLLVAASLFAGFGLGGLRVLMKTLYPNRSFGRQDDAPIIQLKLDQELTRKELGK